eukprot:1355495-Amphidinium_carterae.1
MCQLLAASSHTLSSTGTLPLVPMHSLMHSQGQRGYEPKPAHAGSPSTSMRPHDLGTIPQGKVRSVVTAFNLDRRPLSTAGTDSPPRTLTPREEVQLEVPRTKETMRTLEATRAEQQELYLKIDENEDELVQLRLQAQRAHGDGQTPGLPNPSVVTTLLYGTQQVPVQGSQQGVASRDEQAEFEQAYEHFKRTGCVPVPNPIAPVPSVPVGLYGEMPTMTVQEGLVLPEVLPAPSTSPIPAPPGPSSYLFQTPPRTAMFPTIEQLRAPSSSSLPSTNRLSQSQSQYGGTGNSPPSYGGSSQVPMAASARAAPGPVQPTTGPSLTELRKAKTTLPTLQFQGQSAVYLIKTWKEWTLRVQVAMSSWNEHTPAYWLE